MAAIDKVLQHRDLFLALVRDFPDIISYDAKLHRDIIHTYLKAVGSKVISDASKGKDEVTQQDTLVTESFLILTENCRVVVTRNGHIFVALVPSARIGDTLCIFHGISVPFVLAPTTDGRFKLSGHVSIHGVMGGELVDQSKAEVILLE
jgi:hypothetical protein